MRMLYIPITSHWETLGLLKTAGNYAFEAEMTAPECVSSYEET